MPVKIIEASRAPNPRRVRMFLAEKGVTVPMEQIDLARGDHKTPEFTALNPMQRVPVLILDDGTVLCETVAICRYFERLQPEPALMGRGALDEAVVEMWNRRVELGLFWPVSQCFRHGHPAMAALEVPQVPAWADANRPRAFDMLALLDRALADRPFIAGDAYTIADITALVAVDFMKPARLPRPEGLPALDGWYERVAARPSALA